MINKLILIEKYEVVLVLVPALVAFTLIFIILKYIIPKKSSYMCNIKNIDWMYWAILFLIGAFFAISLKFPFIFMAKELNLAIIFFYMFLAINSSLSAFIIFEINRSPQGKEFTFNKFVFTFLISLIFLALFPTCVAPFIFIFMEYFSCFFLEIYPSFFIKFIEKSLDNIIPVAYADSDSESISSLSSAATTYSYGHMNAQGIDHPLGPSNVRPEDFSHPTEDFGRMNNAQQSMDKLLYTIYNNLFPNNQELLGILNHAPFYSAVDEAAYHEIEHPWYSWTHTNSVDDIRDIHTLRCLISKITGHIDFLSQPGFTYHGNLIDTKESIALLEIIRNNCNRRIGELSTLTEGNQVSFPQLTSRSISPVAESSAQGAARAIREATQESWSRARWEARIRAQKAAFEAAEQARIRNANMEDSSSTSYKGKGKSTDK